jgi:hypothetical protein
MSEIQIPTVQDESILRENLAQAIEKSGLKKGFIAGKFDRSPGWLSKVLDGSIPLTEELKTRFEELLKVQL